MFSNSTSQANFETLGFLEIVALAFGLYAREKDVARQSACTNLEFFQEFACLLLPIKKDANYHSNGRCLYHITQPASTTNNL
jgi:hypothetical protein